PRFSRDWSSDVCSSDLLLLWGPGGDADPRVGFGRLVGDGPVEDEETAELGGRAQSADDVQAVGVAVVDEDREAVHGVRLAAAEALAEVAAVGLERAHAGIAFGEQGEHARG